MSAVTRRCECGSNYTATDADEAMAIEHATLQVRACRTTREHSARMETLKTRQAAEQREWVRGTVRATEELGVFVRPEPCGSEVEG